MGLTRQAGATLAATARGQEGSAQFDDEIVNYRTVFTKLSWVF